MLEHAAGSDDAELLVSRQNLLSDFGVSAVMLKLLSCENSALYLAGLQLGEMLLKGGNARVQSEIVACFSNADEGDTAALDGSTRGFFLRLRDALRLAAKEIPERITYLETQV